MTLSTNQKNWLADFVSPGPGQSAPISMATDLADKKAALREQLLEEANAEISIIKPSITDLMATVNIITKDGKTMPLMRDDADPDKEVDTVEDVKEGIQFSKESEAALLELKKTYYPIIVGIKDRLITACMTPTGDLGVKGELLFDEEHKKEVTFLLWSPLVRDRVLPENLVPGKFSEVEITFKGANEGYRKRLEAFSKTPAAKHETLFRALGVGKEVTSTLGTMAGDLAGGIANFQNMPVAQKDEILNAIQLVNVSTEALFTFAEQGLKRDDGQSVIKALGSIAAAAVGVSGLPSETQAIIAKSIAVGVNSTAVMAKLVKGDWEGAVECLGDVLAASCQTAGKAKGDEVLGDIGALAGDCLKESAKLGKFVTKCANPKATTQDRIDAFADLMSGGIVLIFDSYALGKDEVAKKVEEKKKEEEKKKQAEEKDPEKLEELKKEAEKEKKEQEERVDVEERRLDAINEDVENQSGQREAVKTKAEDLEEGRKQREELDKAKEERLKKMAEEFKKKPPPQRDEKAEKEWAEQEKKDEEEKLAKEAQEFNSLLANGLSGAADEADDAGQQARLALSKIQPLITKLKVDKAIMSAVDTMMTMGIAVASKCFPPATAAMAFKEFAKNVMLAIQHGIELNKWQGSVNDGRMSATSSALVAAELNRVGLEERYISEAFVMATLKMIEGIGAVIGTVGAHAAPVGIALQASSQAAQGVAKLTFLGIDQAALSLAWSSYQKALATPGNRKQIRRTLTANATISKYAIAYAAQKMRNPLAKDIMQKINLSDRVLQDKDTHIDSIVEYMETLYDRDPVVMRAVPIPKDWWPGDPALTVKNWMSFYEAGTKSAKPKLAKGSVTHISGAIGALEVGLKTYDDAVTAATITLALRATTQGLIETTVEVLQAYEPKNDDKEGKTHADMQNYCESLLSQLELRMRLVKSETEEQKRNLIDAAVIAMTVQLGNLNGAVVTAGRPALEDLVTKANEAINLILAGEVKDEKLVTDEIDKVKVAITRVEDDLKTLPT